jgi:hypothetical protein
MYLPTTFQSSRLNAFMSKFLSYYVGLGGNSNTAVHFTLLSVELQNKYNIQERLSELGKEFTKWTL